MKLLFDENLPASLVSHSRIKFPGSTHVRLQRLERASDSDIWDYAKRLEYCIVTKDGDFRHLSFAMGAPPKVIWLRLGNCCVVKTAEILQRNGDRIERFLNEPASSILELRDERKRDQAPTS